MVESCSSGICPLNSSKNAVVDEWCEASCPSLGLQRRFVEEFLKTESNLKGTALPEMPLHSHCKLLRNLSSHCFQTGLVVKSIYCQGNIFITRGQCGGHFCVAAMIVQVCLLHYDKALQLL